MVDWSAGRYEQTAAELAPVSEHVVARAAPAPHHVVVDVACGTGNAALLAAARGATVIGVDGADRLLGVAHERATERGVELHLRTGDLLALPVEDEAADHVISVFGIIFASEPAGALREVARITKPEGRIHISAWIPAGPVDGMIAAMCRVIGEATGQRPPQRFPWSDPQALEGLTADAGLTLASTERAELEIRDASPEAYMAAQQEHPMALAMRPATEQAGVARQAFDAGLDVLREANEAPGEFLIHSPYVIHELRRK